ncbi:glycosyltransferase [Citreimonas salinaria]|uniref:Glycosyltransferase involved in cell wall bisynthesis n=1 Tax=Citreimonas salinaria TaxID=321339 RepID=A0A1H3IWI1_9RHOB|nr:glycosyltransferase [Citreimonas salinaria]SDY31695.1 Glycosyltransferase involved in cell wall bisynthesis [Citreimonas salinaria]
MVPRRALWLVNQYPKVSHTFIAREIAAMERLGWQIDRVSIRDTPAGEDHAALADEAVRTHRVLAQGAGRLLRDAVVEAWRAPVAMWSAARAAWRMGGRSERGRLVHLVYLAEAAHVARRCRATGASHIHAHFGTNSAAVALLASRLSGLPYSFTTHGPEEFDAPRALSLGDKLAGAAFAVAISQFGASQLRRWAPDARIEVVRCGPDLSAFDGADAPPPDAPVLVCVGRLSEQKGHIVLLEAAARVAARVPGFHMVLVGDGPLRPVLEARIAQLGLQKTVTITGWADESAVRDHIRAARAMVLASFAEGLPVVIMEAFALRRPVVATWVAGIPELVDETCGWRVAAGDVDALAGAMETAVTAPADRLASMGQAGRTRVESLHDGAVEAAKLSTLMDEVAHTGGSR